MQLKIKNKSEKQKKQIKNNWKTETQQKTQKKKKKQSSCFSCFSQCSADFPSYSFNISVLQPSSFFCLLSVYFLYFVFLSSHLLFVCCLLFDHFLCWVFVFQLCLFCFFFVFLICVLFSVFFDGFLFVVFSIFFRNQHFSGHSESLKSDVIQHVGNIGRGKSLRSIFLGLSDRKI